MQSELTGLEQSLFRTMPHMTVCSHALQVMTSKYSTQHETRERFCDSSSVLSPGTNTLTRIHFSSSLCMCGGEGGGRGSGVILNKNKSYFLLPVDVMDGDLVDFVGFSLKCLEGGQGLAELNILCCCKCQVDVLCVHREDETRD